MKRVLTALVLIPLVLLAVFRAPDWLFTALVGVVAVLATIEYLQIAAKYGYKMYPVLTCGFLSVLFLAAATSLYFMEGMAIVSAMVVILMIFAPSLLLMAAMRREDFKESLPGAALSLFALPYIGLAMLCLAVIRTLPFGWFAVLFTFFAVWVGDTAAYYVGRSMGKRKFAARISPKKTWEGAIASVVGAMVVGVAFTLYAPKVQAWGWSTQGGEMLKSPAWWVPAVIALVINVAAQLGDLFESLIKRGAEVKDSGTMLPGHGGILDRIDALLFAAPVGLVMFLIFGSRFI